MGRNDPPPPVHKREVMYSFINLSLITIIAVLVVRQIDRARRRQASLPPGPKGLPILGNIRDIANRQEHLWTTYCQWAQRFGDIFHLNVVGSHTIVLNSHEAITELLEKRSQNYSDRPGKSLHALAGIPTHKYCIDMPMLVGLIGYARSSLPSTFYSLVALIRGGWQIACEEFNRFHRVA